MENYLEATQELGKKFYLEFNGKGKIVMLNLLKFNDIADYSSFDEYDFQEEISGKDAYQLYIDKALPELEKAGSRVLYFGKSNSYLIGPESESWDAVLLVEHESVTKFMEFANNSEYLKNKIHRTAALKDSRLLPTIKSE